MSDERLRRAERRWQQTGSVEDRAEVLRERLRLGVIQEGCLQTAASLGDEAASIASGVLPVPLKVEGFFAEIPREGFYEPLCAAIGIIDTIKPMVSSAVDIHVLEDMQQSLVYWHMHPTKRVPHLDVPNLDLGDGVQEALHCLAGFPRQQNFLSRFKRFLSPSLQAAVYLIAEYRDLERPILERVRDMIVPSLLGEGDVLRERYEQLQPRFEARMRAAGLI